MRSVFLQEETAELFEVDRVNRNAQRLGDFAEPHSIEHDFIVALQHLSRDENKLAFNSVAR
jgi:hypothetical protein